MALDELDARIDVGDLDPSELGLAEGGNLCLITRHGALDVMQELKGLRDYDQLREHAVPVDLPGVDETLWFAGYEQLVAMKSAAGRPQDLIDIADMRRARGEE